MSGAVDLQGEQAGRPRRFATARRRLARALSILGIALLGLIAVAVVTAALRHFGMSASAPAVVERVVPATWTSSRHVESGYAITYTFDAGGTAYRDTENRAWQDVTAAAAKVCFDPGKPGEVHVLVPGSYTCAGLNPFEDYGQ